MLKRVRWIGMGAVLGAGGSLWAQVTIRRRARRWHPGPATARAVDAASELGREVRGALDEGRRAMREREDELRSRLEPPRR